MPNRRSPGLNYVPLSPNHKLEYKQYKSYYEFLNKSLKDDKINNIAISGNYGVGKSSIIESFFSRYKEYSIIQISFMNFNNIKEKNILEDNELEKYIEYKIIEQLVNTIEPDKIKYSKFNNTIVPINKLNILKTIITMFIFIISTSILLEFKIVSPFINILKNMFFSYYFFIFFISIISSFYLFYTIIFYLLEYKKIPTKLNYKDFSINLGDEQEAVITPFDNYLNEIIYLIKYSGKNIFIFEDLDRFDTNIIFTKLRYINNLLNNGNDRSKKYKFIYLVKDNLFLEEERVKFFDIILPVTPLHPKNSIFLNLKKYHTNLEENLVDAIYKYISDIRLLTNIYNEYLLTYNYVNDVTPDIINENNLLAFITYKNIFPYDYSQLLNNKGFLYDVFNPQKDYKVESPLAKEMKKNLDDLRSEYAEFNFNNEQSEIYDDISKKEHEQFEHFSIADWQSYYEEQKRQHSDFIKSQNQEYYYKNKKILNEQINTMKRNIELEEDRFEKFLKDSALLKDKETINNNYLKLLYFLINSGYINANYYVYLRI